MHSTRPTHSTVGIAKRMAALLVALAIAFLAVRSWAADGGLGAQGDPCDIITNPCNSGLFCQDGYCCDSACNRGCEACNQPNALGTCGVVPFGTPGRATNPENKPNCLNILCDHTSPFCRMSCDS